MRKQEDTYPVAVVMQQHTSLKGLARIACRNERRHRVKGVANDQNRVPRPDVVVAQIALLGLHPPLRAHHSNECPQIASHPARRVYPVLYGWAQFFQSISAYRLVGAPDCITRFSVEVISRGSVGQRGGVGRRGGAGGFERQSAFQYYREVGEFGRIMQELGDLATGPAIGDEHALGRERVVFEVLDERIDFGLKVGGADVVASKWTLAWTGFDAAGEEAGEELVEGGERVDFTEGGISSVRSKK